MVLERIDDRNVSRRFGGILLTMPPACNRCGRALKNPIFYRGHAYGSTCIKHERPHSITRVRNRKIYDFNDKQQQSLEEFF